jgi:hypothetical protein
MAKYHRKFKNQAMKFFIIITLACFTSSCKYLLHQKSIKIKNHMELFDIGKYKNLSNRNLSSFEESNNIITLSESADYYIKKVTPLLSNFNDVFLYYKNNLVAKSETHFFQTIPIGIHKEFNEVGEVILEKDWDEAYPFSIYEVKDKINQLYHVDISMSNSRTGVTRGSENGVVCYEITLPLSDSPKGNFRTIKLNGITGEVISDEVSEYEEY